jgi:tripartite tricarboxylate transporter TctB family protein
VTLRHPDAVGAVAITLVATLVIVGALTGADPGFGVVRPATFPVVIGTLMLASAAWLGFDTLRGRATGTFEAIDRRPLLATMLAAALFLLAFVPVGFVLTAIPYLVAQSRILGSQALVRDAIAAAVFVVAIYFLFVRFLGIDLPNGPLPF